MTTADVANLIRIRVLDRLGEESKRLKDEQDKLLDKAAADLTAALKAIHADAAAQAVAHPIVRSYRDAERIAEVVAPEWGGRDETSILRGICEARLDGRGGYGHYLSSQHCYGLYMLLIAYHEELGLTASKRASRSDGIPGELWVPVTLKQMDDAEFGPYDYEGKLFVKIRVKKGTLDLSVLDKYAAEWAAIREAQWENGCQVERVKDPARVQAEMTERALEAAGVDTAALLVANLTKQITRRGA